MGERLFQYKIEQNLSLEQLRPIEKKKIAKRMQNVSNQKSKKRRSKVKRRPVTNTLTLTKKY